MLSSTDEILQLSENASLKQVSIEVSDDLGSPALDALITKMFEIMEAKGVGLAAPQIGLNMRILVYGMKPELAASRHVAPIPYRALINPRITYRSEALEEGVEGCLSIDGERFSVPRHETIRFDAQHADGRWLRDQEAHGYEARIIQHEVDHLEGMLIADRGRKL